MRDLRRNRTTTSATLVLLSLSPALFGAVLLAGGQLQLVAAFIAGIAAPAVAVGGLAALIANVRMVAAARRLEGLRWVGFEQLLAISPGLLVLGILAGLVAATLAVSIYR